MAPKFLEELEFSSSSFLERIPYSMVCLNCGEQISPKKKFCNNQCQKEFQYKSYIQKWKEGKIDGIRGEYQISMYIKTYLFKKYHNKCARCGWSERNQFTHSIPLEIEHIDGNYKNNKEDNLILLCPNCHSLTATYKGANVNHGRKSRKKYSK